MVGVKVFIQSLLNFSDKAMVTVFGPTWGRRSRRGWRQGSRGWGEQENEEQEELEEEEKGIQRWLSSGELLGVGQVSNIKVEIFHINPFIVHQN